MNKSVAEKISELISPDSGKPMDLTDSDRQFIDEYEKHGSQLGKEQLRLYFKNVIRHEGSCGFANRAYKDILINTDSNNSYYVTVRTFWQGVTSGSEDQRYSIAAGSKMFLGCSESSTDPITQYSRTVVGEVKI